MNKDELGKYIIVQVKSLINKGQMDMAVLGSAVLDLEQFADNIISKIPEESAITEADIEKVLIDFYYQDHSLNILNIKKIAKKIMDKGEK